MNDNKDVARLLGVLERMDKAGSIKKMFKNAPEIPKEDAWKTMAIPCPESGKSFKDIYDFCMIKLSAHIDQIEQNMAWANFLSEYCDLLYYDYKSRIDDIKAPEVARFIKDYEEFYGDKAGKRHVSSKAGQAARRKAYNRKYWKENKEKIKEQRAGKASEYNEYQREWKNQNREKYNKYQREYQRKRRENERKSN